MHGIFGPESPRLGALDQESAYDRYEEDGMEVWDDVIARGLRGRSASGTPARANGDGRRASSGSLGLLSSAQARKDQVCAGFMRHDCVENRS